MLSPMMLSEVLAGAMDPFTGWGWWLCVVGLIAVIIFYVMYRKRQY